MCIGVGGADAVDVMADIPWELKCPKVLTCNIYLNDHKETAYIKLQQSHLNVYMYMYLQVE